MTSGDLQTGDAVFVDANVLTYHYQPHPKFGPASLTFLHFRTAIEEVDNSRLHILTITPDTLVRAAEVCQQHGLLTNDGLTVAIMQAHGLTRIASGDADFDNVPGLARYAPA